MRPAAPRALRPVGARQGRRVEDLDTLGLGSPDYRRRRDLRCRLVPAGAAGR